MATRKPVVALGIGGTPAQIHNGVAGLLFAPSEQTDIRRQVDRVSTDPDLRSLLWAL